MSTRPDQTRGIFVARLACEAPQIRLITSEHGAKSRQLNAHRSQSEMLRGS